MFNRLGFRGTTISAVANELSIDRASLYYYISSKEELFDELVREVSDANLAMAQKIQGGEGSPAQKLDELIRDLMAAYARSYPILYIYIRENLADVSDKRSKWAKYMKRVNHDYDSAVIAIIEEGYSDGSFQYIGPARVIAFGILGMVGWTNRWFNPDTSHISAQEIGRVYADLIINGLTSGNAAMLKKPAKTKKGGSSK